MGTVTQTETELEETQRLLDLNQIMVVELRQQIEANERRMQFYMRIHFRNVILRQLTRTFGQNALRQ